jgi:hypothetical protein
LLSLERCTASRGEAGNANVDGGLEHLLMAEESALTFLNCQALLENPNLWIADAAAMVHTTLHKQGSSNNRAATRGDPITVGNDRSKTASEIANVPGDACNEHGNDLTKGTLKDVTLLPTRKFNLFSLSKMLTLRWEMGGNKTSVWIKKGDQKIEFNICAAAPKGALCLFVCMKCPKESDNEVANPAVGKLLTSRKLTWKLASGLTRRKCSLDRLMTRLAIAAKH